VEKVFDITNIITLESIELWTALELPPVAGLSDLHQPLEWKVPDYGVVYHTGPQRGGLSWRYLNPPSRAAGGAKPKRGVNRVMENGYLFLAGHWLVALVLD